MKHFDSAYRENTRSIEIGIFGRVLSIISRSENGRNEEEQGNMEFLEENGFNTSLLNTLG